MRGFQRLLIVLGATNLRSWIMAGMALRPRPAVSCTKILVSKACTRSVSSRAALMYFPGQIVGHGKEPGLWTSMLLSTQLAPVMIRPTPPAARRTK
jgi:hypothetical protein